MKPKYKVGDKFYDNESQTKFKIVGVRKLEGENLYAGADEFGIFPFEIREFELDELSEEEEE